jgi:hypothetical protein
MTKFWIFVLCLIGAGLLAWIAGSIYNFNSYTAVANGINDKTLCVEAFRAYDHEDTTKVKAIGSYVLRTMRELDTRHILDAMSEDGLISTTVAPIELCRRNQGATLFSQVIGAYNGIVSARRQMGIR